MIERTFIMIKPDAVGRRLAGEIIRRYEIKGLQLAGMKIQVLTRELAAAHYAEHEGRPYYEPLLDFITSGPSIQMVWEGQCAIAAARELNGKTNPLEADVGSIRGDYGLKTRNNLVHASDSAQTAEREIAIYFKQEELISYRMPDAQWLEYDGS